MTAAEQLRFESAWAALRDFGYAVQRNKNSDGEFVYTLYGTVAQHGRVLATLDELEAFVASLENKEEPREP